MCVCVCVYFCMYASIYGVAVCRCLYVVCKYVSLYICGGTDETCCVEKVISKSLTQITASEQSSSEYTLIVLVCLINFISATI